MRRAKVLGTDQGDGDAQPAASDIDTSPDFDFATQRPSIGGVRGSSAAAGNSAPIAVATAVAGQVDGSNSTSGATSYSTAVYPYNDVVLIETANPGDPTHFFEGSGLVIGPHTILTASHMLWDTSDQTEANQVWLYPAYNQNGIPNPPGSGSALSTAVLWHNNDVGVPNSNPAMISQSDSQFDFAVIDTSYTFTSWFGVDLNYTGGTVHVTGYPATANGVQTDSTGTVSLDSTYSLLDYGTLSVSSGNSGGPLWINTPNGPEVVGVVSTGSWATQLTSADWSTIQNWINLDASLWAPRPATSDDLNGDGHSDILWRQAGGALADWSMSGSAISAAYVTSGGSIVAPDASWSVAAVTDFNGDHKADVLWRSSSGLLADWFMNGSTISSSGYLNVNGTPVMPDPSWSIAGVGDLDDNGSSDLLWRDTSGATAVWMMNGASIVGSNYLNVNGTIVTPDPTWTVAAMGDFNGDTYSDLLWRNSVTGELADWQLRGSSIVGSGDLTLSGVAVRPDASWNIVGVGDFNGDGNADLLWQNSSTGLVSEWLMNGSTVISSAAMTFNGSSVVAGSGWSVAEIGDFNDDGRSDILWRNSTTGALDEFLMSGSTVTSSVSPASGGSAVNPDLSWSVQGKPTDFT